MPNSSQWRYIILNGLFGTVLSEYMGCFLTSSLIATLSLCLVIPMTLLVDHILWKTEFSIALYIGTIPVLISFFGATYLSLHEDWDPVAAGIRWLYNKLNFCARLKNKLSGAKSRTELDEEQSESLIDECYRMVAKLALKKQNCLNNKKLNDRLTNKIQIPLQSKGVLSRLADYVVSKSAKGTDGAEKSGPRNVSRLGS
ncbi:Solute carrier family 35 member F5 [Trichinella pseudospiralis]|uniref:Solute carrier family 35 member F5 n=1 Tax=Trichinella pseudospiralis TaxID=6337 RepID=A0A0V0YBB4_TRIPS|nr:Solute carrier family 35 member F5 [Trichinella pseudospiralis]